MSCISSALSKIMRVLLFRDIIQRLHAKIDHNQAFLAKTSWKNRLKKPKVSTIGSMTEMAVLQKTQMNEMIIQPVKKPFEKM